MKRTIEAYRNSQVYTASSGELLLALYDGVARFCVIAKEAIENKDPSAKGVAIGRAYDILTELTASLDRDKDKQLCVEMTDLYNYWASRLQMASMKMDPAPVDEVIRHVKEMRSTWHQALDIARKEGIRV
jgi:flagellar protein FliS